MYKLEVDWTFPIRKSVTDEFGHTWTVFNNSDWDSVCDVMSQVEFQTYSEGESWSLWSDPHIHHECFQWEMPGANLNIRNEENEIKLKVSFTLITDEEAQEEHWEGSWESRLNVYLSWAQWFRAEGIPFITDLPDWENYPDVPSPIKRPRHVVLEWATTHIRAIHGFNVLA